MISSNNGVLTKATDAKKANEEGISGDRVRLAAQSALIDGEGTINISDATGEVKGSLKKALIEEFGSGSEVVGAYVTGKVTVGEEIYSVSTTGKVTKLNIQWELPEEDTHIDIGDLLTPTDAGLENEKFYVIEENGEILTLFAKNCIDITQNKQVPNNYSTVNFDDNKDTDLSYNTSTIKTYVDLYAKKLTDGGLILENVELEYHGNKVNGLKGRLAFGNIWDILNTDFNDILYGNPYINYWCDMVSLNNPNTEYEWWGVMKISNGEPWDNTGGKGELGIRPVIKILKSNVQQ